MDEFGSRDQTKTPYLLTKINNMKKRFYKLSELYSSDIMPIARSKIMELIKNGELQKE